MIEKHLSSEETVELFERYVIGNYKRLPVNLVRGEGSLVWDSEGREYLDFFPGWGCNLLGHCPPRIVEAIKQQVGTLIHVPNTWHMELQGRWAELLCERTFESQAFFCNSGAEANEAAIKLARLHQGPKRFKIITFTGGFHGRTLGALTATAQPKYHEGLGPLVAGFQYCPFDDLSAVTQRVDDETAAIMIEPIQGEGGVKLPSPEFLSGLRALCDRHDLLLIFDEVQTGCGRTGEWFAHQYFGVEPDIMTLAKSLCGGIAGGAMIARRTIAPSLRPGMHASTFGGNPIAAAAGIAMIETVEEEGLLPQCKVISAQFAKHLTELKENCEAVRAIRQAGVMIGIELDQEGAPIVSECMKRGLLINCTQANVLRLLPALNIESDQLNAGMEILSQVVMEVTSRQPQTT